MSKSYKKHLETTPNFKPIVYICAPYRGDKEKNVQHAIQITGGMQVEINLAEKRRQPIKYFTDKDLGGEC